MGWAYYKLGDSEKAQEALVEARKEAEKLDDAGDQAQWLQALGYIYLDGRKFDDAEASYQSLLKLATKWIQSYTSSTP